MFSNPKPLLVAAMTLFTLLINLPCGYFRNREKKYSLKWFLFIHIPIPLIALARILTNLDMRYIPVFVLAAVLGQFCGGRIEFQAK